MQATLRVVAGKSSCISSSTAQSHFSPFFGFHLLSLIIIVLCRLGNFFSRMITVATLFPSVSSIRKTMMHFFGLWCWFQVPRRTLFSALSMYNYERVRKFFPTSQSVYWGRIFTIFRPWLLFFNKYIQYSMYNFSLVILRALAQCKLQSADKRAFLRKTAKFSQIGKT